MILRFVRIANVIQFKTILIFTALFQVVLAQENYCHDEKVNAYWDDLAIRAVDHSDVINLYKLRKDLCTQIDSGELTVDEATEKFSKSLINHRRPKCIQILLCF